jgi:hypothetical protein
LVIKFNRVSTAEGNSAASRSSMNLICVSNSTMSYGEAETCLFQAFLQLSESQDARRENALMTSKRGFCEIELIR